MILKKSRILLCFVVLLLFTKHGSGQNWLPLGNGMDGSINQVYADTGANILYVIGIFSANNNNIFGGVAKWNGTEWDTLPNCQVFPTKFMVLKYMDTLYISGFFSSIPQPGSNITKWNGSIFDTIAGTRDMNLYCMAERNGLLYLGGAFEKCDNDPAFSLCTYNGHHFNAITPAYNDDAYVYCMAFYKDTLYVGGIFNLYPLSPVSSFAKWNGADLVSVSNEFANVNSSVFAMAVYKDELYIGGHFTKADGFTGDYIMKWDGHQFTEVGGGANYRVTCMKVYNNELYVGGWFTRVGNMDCNNVAKWDGTQWTCLNNDEFDFTNSINDLCILNDRLYIAGQFQKIGNDSIRNIAMYNHPLTSVQEYNEELAASVCPNPFHDKTKLEFSKPLQRAVLRIYDMLGKEVQHKEGLSGKEITISRGSMSNGMYFYRVIDGNIIIGQGKFVVE